MKPSIVKNDKNLRRINSLITNNFYSGFIVDDKFGTPTYTNDFAKNTLALIESDNFGLYNMACEGNTSRLEVTEEILKILNLKYQILRLFFYYQKIFLIIKLI